MSTNEVIGALIIALGSILGVGTTIVKPLVQNVKAMTELTESVKALTEKFGNFEVNNHDDHKRIWTHNEEQDDLLNKHETRITVLENEVAKK